MSAPVYNRADRAFHVEHEAWCATDYEAPEFLIGYYPTSESDGDLAEFNLRLVSLVSLAAAAWRLEVFEDAWAALGECSDLLAGLAGLRQGAHPNEVADMLRRLGFRDATART